MPKVVLLPFGESGHVDSLLNKLAELVEARRESEFALLLPTRHLLHAYRYRLVRKAAGRLNLVTFDELVTEALRAARTKVTGISGQVAVEIIQDILQEKAAELPALGAANPREIASELVFCLGQLRRAKISLDKLKQENEQTLVDLAVVGEEYVSFLRKRGLADIEEQYCLAADSLCEVSWLQRVLQLHICWFFDFEPLQLDLIQAACTLVPATTLWLPYEHVAHADHLQETLFPLQEMGFKIEREGGNIEAGLVAELFKAQPEAATRPLLYGLGAPRLKQELEQVAREIKKLTAFGTKAKDICLVIPDMEKYLPPMRRLYKDQGIELSAPLVMRLVDVPWLKELLRIWRAVSRDWDRESLLLIAKNVYIINHLPDDSDGGDIERAVNSLEAGLEGEQWLLKLFEKVENKTQALKECQEPRQQESISQSLTLYQRAHRGVKACMELALPLSRPLLRQDHCQFMRDLLQENEDRLCLSVDSLQGVRDRVAWSKFASSLEEYLACCRLLQRDCPISAGHFLEEIIPWLKQSIRLEFGSHEDIQVLSPTQVRGLSFEWVFVLGLNHGVFPHPGTDNWLLTRAAKALGRGQIGSNAIECQKVFFHSCVAAATVGLCLSRQLPGIDPGAEISAFWRAAEIAAAKMSCKYLDSSDLLPLAQEATSQIRLIQRLVFDLAQGQALPTAAQEWLRGWEGYVDLYTASNAIQERESALPPNSLDGVLNSSASALAERFEQAVYSISRLEQYASCPFAFFARYCLKLDAEPWDQQEYTSLTVGVFLHWLLEKFYQDGHAKAVDISNPDTIRRPLKVLARQWVIEAGFGPEEQLWKLRSHEAIDYVTALICVDLAWQRKTGFRPVFFETSFGFPDSAIGTVSPGNGIHFHGVVDRVDVLEKAGETQAIVYDYKTSREITKGAIIKGKSLQIPVYFLAAQSLLESRGYSAVNIVGGGYFVIKKAKLAGGIWEKEFIRSANSSLGSLDKAEFDNLLPSLAVSSKKMHEAILAGAFAPKPEGEVCRWCDYARCCRYDKYRFELKEVADET